MRAKNNTGAIRNKTLLLLWETISLIKSLSPSANGCNNPNTPTTEGPRRLEYWPLIFFLVKLRMLHLIKLYN